MKVLVTGAAGALGRRVTGLLGDAGSTVVAIDGAGAGVAGGAGEAGTSLVPGDGELTELCDGVDVVVHLARSVPPDAASIEQGAADLDGATRLLRAAASGGVRHVVLVSSAMVYGAWANNPVPLTEDAPVRPNPELPYAVHLAELERRAFEWRSRQPDASLAVLRPAVIVADGEPEPVARLLHRVATIRTDEGDPPVQFLHVDDLATAIATVVATGADGVINVAPDGWIPAQTFDALVSNAPRPRLPLRVVQRLASARWRLGLASAPPGLVSYMTHPWVVANDRLRSLGWEAANTNEEAFVAGHAAGPLDRLNARRRQQLALGVSGGVIGAVLVAAGGFLARRRWRSG